VTPVRKNTWASLPLILLLFSLPCCAQTQDDPDKTRPEKPSSAGFSTVQTHPQAQIASSAARPTEDKFVIGADDVLAVNVWKEADITRTVTVRSDGKITLPLLGELQASTKTPKQLEEDISSKLSDFISDPAVTVTVQEVHSQRFNILGRVEHPGSYPLKENLTVLDAIALAGGLRDFAKQKSIYILRRNPDGTQVRLIFNYKEVIRGQNLKQNIKLELYDTVVVP
jgi:polysaccharide export outer membrane protein